MTSPSDVLQLILFQYYSKTCVLISDPPQPPYPFRPKQFFPSLPHPPSPPLLNRSSLWSHRLRWVLSCQLTSGYTEMTKGDKLVLRGLKFHGYHGVKPEERVLGQKFLIDVDAWMDLQAAGNSDNLSDTISYTAIYRIVKEIVEGTPHNLLESVAQLIASTTLSKFPQISAVRVQVGKPHVAVLGPVDYLGVEIIRYRKNEEQS